MPKETRSKPPATSADETSGPSPEYRYEKKEREAAETLAMMSEIEAALTLVDMKSVVDADISTAVEEAEKPVDVSMSGGGKRKFRGGSLTAAALKELTKNTLTSADEKIKAADRGFATLINNTSLGATLKTIAVVKFLQDPYVFTDLVQTLRGTWAQWVPEAAPNAGYRDALNAILEAGKYTGKFLTTDQADYIQGSPLYTFALVSTATLLVRYLANQQGMSGFDYLKAKAKYALSVLGMAYTTAKEAVQTYGPQPETPQDKKTRLLKQLREASAKIQTSKIKYEGVGPAVVPGLMIQVPSPAVLTAEAAKRLAETVSKIVVVLPDTEVANILAAMAAAVPAAAPAGGRRRKTKKRVVKKRRMTRRQAMPRFTY
jgi:hypothetical protein